MPGLVCYVVKVNLPAGITIPNDFTLKQRPIGEYISKPLLPTPFDLTFDRSNIGKFPGADGGQTSLEMLQSSLTGILAGRSVTNSIALLLTGRMAFAPDAVGHMFDETGYPGMSPRRGLALSLTNLAIQAGDDLSDPDARDYIGYTLIHEFGHLLNLWHLQGSDSFMNPNLDVGHLPAATFDKEQLQYLRLMADAKSARYVLPGGSALGERPYPWQQGD